MATMTNTTDPTDTTIKTNKIEVPMRTSHLGRRVLRVFLRGMAVILSLVVGLVLLGASYEAISAMGDAKANPPPAD